METRRLSFPRFFFLHDFALLKVLEHSLKMHTHFDAHAHHCFPGIRAIQAGTFDKTTDRTKPVLTQVHSTSNETLTLTKPVSGGVDFLPMVSRQIGVALRDVFHNAKKVLDFSGGEIPIRSMEVLLLLIPVSMLSTLAQCEWCSVVERHLRLINDSVLSAKEKETNMYEKLENMSTTNIQLSTSLVVKIRKLLRTHCHGLVSDEIDMRVRLTRGETLLLHDLCARDSTQALIANGVDSIDHSEWSIRSKMSLTRGEGIMLNVGNIRIDYGFELVGAEGMGASHLVLSHTVMRCMWAIAHATQMLNCCALVHPASQGQLNLIHGMASVCAIYSPGVKFSVDVHHEYIARVIKGASACSCWLRLSNLYSLDKISSAVLGQSISNLVLAVQRGLPKMTMDGVEVPIQLRTTLVGVECTGHEFESRFPKQLRQFFHTTGIITADTLRISELILTSRGVLDSSGLVGSILKAVSDLVQHAWQSTVYKGKYETSSVLHIVNRAVADVRASKEELDIEHVIAVVIKSMHSVNYKNRYDNSLCTPGDRFMIRKSLKAAKLGHLKYAEKGVVELHCALNLWGMVALVGSHGVGKTSIRRAMFQARDDIRAGPGKKRKKLRRGAARNHGRRASVSLPKGRRSSLISPKRIDMRGSARFIFPETLTFDELYGGSGGQGQWIEGIVGHMIKTMNSEKAAQLEVHGAGNELQEQAPQYVVVDGCHRSPVINVLLNMATRKVLELPNGESIGIQQLGLQVIVEVSSLEWLSPGHVSSIGVVPIGGDVDLPVIFINLCHKISEGALISTFQQQVLSSMQSLCMNITDMDIIGCNDHPTLVMPCAMAASRMIESIVTVAYSNGREGFSEQVPPEIDIIAKAVLCYAFLWSRSAYVENLPVEPTAGLLVEWLEEVAEDLPLAVRRMDPKKMLAISGYLHIEKEVNGIPPVLEATGSISFCHLPDGSGGAYLLSVLAKTGMHAALAGPSRVGKTAIARATTNAIGLLPGTGYHAWYCFVVQHNSFNPHSLGSAISECFSTTYGNVLAGIASKNRVIIVMDDVAATNVLDENDFRSHDRASTFEMDGIRSLVCEKGFHDVSTLLWQRVSFFNIVATTRCTPTSNFAVKNHHFCTVQLEPVASISIQEMYCHVLNNRINVSNTCDTHCTTDVTTAATSGGTTIATAGNVIQTTANLIQPLVKATITTVTLYRVMRQQLALPPVQMDWMFLNLFKESPEATDAAPIIREWFHHARAAFGDQCTSPSTVADLSDTLMSNLHAALGIHGQQVESKNRRISMINSDLACSSEAATVSSTLSATVIQKAQTGVPLDANGSLRAQTNIEFGQSFIAAGSKEHIELFQAMLSVLKTSKPHIAVVSNDIMLSTGLISLALQEAIMVPEAQVKMLRVGPDTRSHRDKQVRQVLLSVLSDAASTLHQKNSRIGLIVQNADKLPLSMAALLTAIASGTYPGDYFTAEEKKDLIHKSQMGMDDLGIDSCWAQTFTRIASRVTVAIVVTDISKMKYKVHLGCTVLALLKLSDESRRVVALTMIKNYKRIKLEENSVNTLADLFVHLEIVMDELNLERSECMFLQSIHDFLESLTRYSGVGKERIQKFETALRFQAVARERSALLNAEGIALNWRLVLVNQKITNLASEVNKCQQSYGTESRRLFAAEKDSTAVKSTVSKLTQEIDKNLMKSNNSLAQARGTMRGVNNADIIRYLKEEELPRVVFRLGVAASQMLGDAIIENDEEELRDFLADPLLLARIVRFDPKRGPLKTALLAARIVQSQPYSKDQVSKFGSAALALREWVHAVAAKIAVLSDIHPLYLQLDNAKLALTARNEALNLAFKSKKQCAERLRGWQKAYDDTIKERARLLQKVEGRKEKLATSSECARAVSSKVKTWKKELGVLREAQLTLVADVWIGTACLRYAAAVSPGQRSILMERMKRAVVEKYRLPLSPNAAFGCPSPGDQAEIDATMLARELHVGVYMLDKITSTHICCLVDPDGIARDFLSTTMKHEDQFERTFDGDMKFLLTLQKAQLNRSTLLIEHVGEHVHDAIWKIIGDSATLDKFQKVYPGFQIILSCDKLPSWITYRGMPNFVVVDFSRPSNDTEEEEGEEVFLNVVDRLSAGNTKHKLQLLLVNIAQDLSDYKEAVNKLLDLVGDDFEELIVNKQTTRRINEAALSVELLQQRTNTAAEKLQAAKDSQKEVRRAARHIVDLFRLLNNLIRQLKTLDVKPLPPLDFLDVIFNIMSSLQDENGGSRSSSLSSEKKKKLPTLETIAKAVMYTFAANCFHRGLRSRLALAAFLYALTRSSKTCYDKLVQLVQSVKSATDSTKELKYRQIMHEENIDPKLVHGFDTFTTYLSKIDLYDEKFDASVHDIDPMLSWSGQNNELASRVFSLIETGLGTHETNVLIHSEYPHPHLMRKFLVACSGLRPVQCLIHNSFIPGVENFLRDDLQKALLLSPVVVAYSSDTIKALRSTISNGGFALCRSEFGAGAVLHHCLSLGYSADFIVKHLVDHANIFMGPKSHGNTCSGIWEETQEKNRARKKPQNKRRLKSTAKTMLKTARLMGGLGGRRTSRLGTGMQMSNGKRSDNSNFAGGTGRRGSLRGSIRSSFMHLDSKHGEDATEVLRNSNFRCCVACTDQENEKMQFPGPFLVLSGEALAEHSVEHSYAVLTRKKHGQMGVVGLAWRAYMHLIHATDLEMRVSKCGTIGVHLNQMGGLRSMEELLAVHFRQVISESEGHLQLSMFFAEKFVGSVLASMLSYYCHDECSIDVYAAVWMENLYSIWIENEKEVKEGNLGNFSATKKTCRVANSLLETVRLVCFEMMK